MITHEDIQKQIKKVFKSPSFASSLLLRQFLQYIVNQTIEKKQKDIKAYNIAVEAFGRESSFDPQKDTIVRITAGKLRKELFSYYASEGENDLIRITVPKGSYIPEFEIIKNSVSSLYKSFLKPPLNYKTILLFVILFALGSTLFYNNFKENKISINKPAILFFEIKNLTLKKENDIWANGITEEISVLSSRFSEIEIYGPISNNQKTIDLNRFNKNDFLFAFNGTLDKSDSLFILNARLSDYRTGKLIWAKCYKKIIDEESLINVEYEICNDISKKIGSIYGAVHTQVLSKTSPSLPKNLSSHKSILQYYKYLKHLTYDEFLVAKNALSQTVKNDPDYGLAWSALGALYVNEHLSFGADSLKSFTIAHEYIKRALKLDPNSVLIQSNWAYIAFRSKQIDKFKQAVSKAQELNPSNIMNGENGLYLVYLGESERGLKMIRQAQKYAISYPGYFHAGPFLDFYRKGKYKEALVEANRINITGSFIDSLCRFLALINLNQTDEAIKAKKELLELIPDFDNKARKILSKVLLKNDVNRIINDLLKVKITPS